MTVALEAAARAPVSGARASHLRQSGVHGFPVFAVERVSFPVSHDGLSQGRGLGLWFR